MYSYDRRTASRHGPVGEILMKRWNILHDLDRELQDASQEYDVAASYKGKPGEKGAEKVMEAIKKVREAISNLADSGKDFDKLLEAETKFVKQHGSPGDYAQAQRDAIYPL